MDHLAKKSFKIAKAVYNAATHPDQYQNPPPGPSQPYPQYGQQPQYGFQQPAQHQQQYSPYNNVQNPSYFPQNAPAQPAPPAPYANPAFHGAPSAPTPPAAYIPPPPYSPSPVNPHQSPYNPHPQPSSQWQPSIPPPTPVTPASWPTTPGTPAPNPIPAMPPPLPHRPATSQFFSPTHQPHQPQVSPPQADSPFGPPQTSSGQETGYIPAPASSYGPQPVNHSQSFPVSPMASPPPPHFPHTQSFPPPQDNSSGPQSSLTPSNSFRHGPQHQQQPIQNPQSYQFAQPPAHESNSFVAELPADPPSSMSSSMPIELPAELPADLGYAHGQHTGKESSSQPTAHHFNAFHPPTSPEKKDASPNQSAAHPFTAYHLPNSSQDTAGTTSMNPADQQTSGPPALNYASHPSAISQPQAHPPQPGSPQPLHATSADSSIHNLDQPRPVHPESSPAATAHSIASMTPASPPAGQAQLSGTYPQTFPPPPSGSPPIANSNPDFPLPGNNGMPPYSPPANSNSGYGYSNPHVGGLAASLQRMNLNNASNQQPGASDWQKSSHQSGAADSKPPLNAQVVHPMNGQLGYAPGTYPQGQGPVQGY